MTSCAKCDLREAADGSNFCERCGGSWNPAVKGQPARLDGA